jgi:hypothetical protein
VSHCAQGFLSLLCMVLEGSCPIVRMSQCCMVLKGSCVVWWSRLQVLYGPQEILVHNSMILTGKGSGLVYFSRGLGLFFMIKSQRLSQMVSKRSFIVLVLRVLVLCHPIGSCVVSSSRIVVGYVPQEYFCCCDCQECMCHTVLKGYYVMLCSRVLKGSCVVWSSEVLCQMFQGLRVLA